MTQALAFINGENPTSRGKPTKLLHLNIKPENILVTYNDRDKPSFKLIDFQLIKAVHWDTPEKETYLRTFDWQPLGTPKIHTRAADGWSMGACVYFLAIRDLLIENTP